MELSSLLSQYSRDSHTTTSTTNDGRNLNNSNNRSAAGNAPPPHTNAGTKSHGSMTTTATTTTPHTKKHDSKDENDSNNNAAPKQGIMETKGNRRRVTAMDKQSASRIASAQVIASLPNAVKELIENALDAEATRIDVNLQNFGADSIEVTDNGTGIDSSDFDSLVNKHHTSKIRNFEDITATNTLGFRGEALASLCSLCEKLAITTCSRNDSVGTYLEYNSEGKLVSKIPKARSQGTTVFLEKLFAPLPVRRKELLRSVKREYSKVLRLLQSYALIAVGVRIKCTVVGASSEGTSQNSVEIGSPRGSMGRKGSNSGSGSSRQLAVASQGSLKLKDNISNVFGPKFLSGLISLNLDLNDAVSRFSEEGDSEIVEEAKHPFSHLSYGGNESQIDNDGPSSAVDRNDAENNSASNGSKSIGKQYAMGFVSMPDQGVGRCTTDRQFLFINGRPVDIPRITKAINEVWRQYEMKRKPAFVLNFLLEPDAFDVNVTPDKREVFLKEENAIISALREKLNSLWQPSERTMQVNSMLSISNKAPAEEPVEMRISENEGNDDEHNVHISSSTTDVVIKQRVLSSREELSSIDDDVMVANTSQENEEKDIATAQTQRNNEETSMSASLESRAASTNVTALNPPCDNEILTSENLLVDHQRNHERISPELECHCQEASTTDGGSPHGTYTHEDSVRSASLHPPKNGSVPPKTLDSHLTPSHSNSRAYERRDSPKVEDETPACLKGRENTASVPPVKRARVQESLLSSDSGTPDGVELREKLSPIESCTETLERRPVVAQTRFSGMKMNVDDRAFASGERRHLNTSDGEACVTGGLFAGVEAAVDVSRSADLAGNAQAKEEAEHALTRVLDKDAFLKMRVLGQFNRGFIIASLLGTPDLFIIDQHASDEIANFEKLQQQTQIHEQPLIQPQNLELPPEEENVILENLHLFKLNGFHFAVDHTQNCGARAKLTALPFSKNTQFGIEDIHELASMLAERDNSYGDQVVRLPKTRSMFASRACRSSVMIGDALGKTRMETIIRNLSTLERPWNCPHGRPTLRHLIDLSTIPQPKQLAPVMRNTK